MQHIHTDLHHIQRSIILSLAARSPQRFSELQPPRLANNTFSYHLKQLVDRNYLAHNDKQYSLTRKSLKLVGMLDSTLLKHVSTPIIATTLHVTNTRNEVLVLNRNQQPFRGWYGLPSGAVHLGEQLEEAARRELFEKTTLVANHFRNVGVLDFQYCQSSTKDVFFHAVSFIFSVRIDTAGDAVAGISTKYGQLSWSKLRRDHILPDALAAHDMVMKGGDDIQHVSKRFIEPNSAPVLMQDTAKSGRPFVSEK